jgi:hypothetical protein
VSRVPAPEIEKLVIDAIRAETTLAGRVDDASAPDRELIEQRVRRVEVRSGTVLIEMGASEDHPSEAAPTPSIFTLPWSLPPGRTRRKVLVSSSVQAHNSQRMPGTGETLLISIGKARSWFVELSSGRIASFGSIAAREGCSERYVRSVLPLAFLAPHVIREAIGGRLREGYAVAQLLRDLPPSWHEQRLAQDLAVYSWCGSGTGVEAARSLASASETSGSRACQRASC